MNRKVTLWWWLVVTLILLLSFSFVIVEVEAKSKENFYKLFDLDRQTFDKTALRKAYYILAKKFHPDKNPGDKEAEEKFKEITHAFEILNDDQKRQVYDVHGEEGLRGGFESDSGFNAQDIFER